MKKPSRQILFLWILITASVAAGTFLIARHVGIGTDPGIVPEPQIGMDVAQDVPTGDAAVSPVAMQTFSSDDGYTFDVPESWQIEKMGTDTIAVHSESVSSAVACKIEVSAFPFTAGTDVADWISHRIGADPSLSVVERSSEDVSFARGSGVKWTGTIDSVPTTLVYAFNDAHAYEIAPSVLGDDADGATPCDEVLDTFLSGLKI